MAVPSRTLMEDQPTENQRLIILRAEAVKMYLSFGPRPLASQVTPRMHLLSPGSVSENTIKLLDVEAFYWIRSMHEDHQGIGSFRDIVGTRCNFDCGWRVTLYGLECLSFAGPYLPAEETDVRPLGVHSSNSGDSTLQSIFKMNGWLNLAEALFIAFEQVAHLRTAPDANDTVYLFCRRIGWQFSALGVALRHEGRSDRHDHDDLKHPIMSIQESHGISR